MWIHQLVGTNLHALEMDILQKIFFHSGLPKLILQNPFAAYLFDLVLLGTMFLAFFYHRSRLLPIMFTVTFFVYYLTGYLFFFARGHNMSGLVIMSILPWFHNANRFTGYFYFLRYFMLYVLASAGLWKLYNGVAFKFEDQMTRILKLQYPEYIIHHPESWRSHWAYFMIQHKWVNQLFLKGALFLQLSCLLGFFTRRFDRLLVVVVLLFFIGDWLVMNLPFYEMYILVITFLPWKALQRVYEEM